jgi:anti-sigma regulatory factor (Ser/Thr protein kinase)
VTGQLSLEPHAHAVSFYVHDQDVVEEVAHFVTEGTQQGGRAVVVATSEHLKGLVETLRAMGLDPDEPPVAGRLLLLDAKETLRSFSSGSGLDRERFLTGVAQRVIDAGADGAPVRLFGEMVSLLWEAGDVQGAIALEAMWNDLIDQHDFDLMCAYPASLIETSSLLEVRAVCDQHSSVHARQQHTAPDSGHGGSSRMFLPVDESVRASRSFVVATLRRLEADHLIHDAAVIVSELATNAVRHARSPFRVSVDESGGFVCISVQDAGDEHAGLPTIAPDDHALDGRGVAIIEALAHRWGYDALADGTVVWAQLAS